MIKRRNARGNGLPDKDRRKGEIYGSGGRNFQRENMAVFHFSPSDQRDSETLQNMTGSCISRTPEKHLAGVINHSSFSVLGYGLGPLPPDREEV